MSNKKVPCMKKARFFLILASAISIFIISAGSGSTALAQFPGIPQTIPFQGLITDLSDNPIRNSSVNLTIRIIDTAAAGCALYDESFVGVPTDAKGIASLQIGSNFGAASKATGVAIGIFPDIFYLNSGT